MQVIRFRGDLKPVPSMTRQSKPGLPPKSAPPTLFAAAAAARPKQKLLQPPGAAVWLKQRSESQVNRRGFIVHSNQAKLNPRAIDLPLVGNKSSKQNAPSARPPTPEYWTQEAQQSLQSSIERIEQHAAKGRTLCRPHLNPTQSSCTNRDSNSTTSVVKVTLRRAQPMHPPEILQIEGEAGQAHDANKALAPGRAKDPSTPSTAGKRVSSPPAPQPPRKQPMLSRVTALPDLLLPSMEQIAAAHTGSTPGMLPHPPSETSEDCSKAAADVLQRHTPEDVGVIMDQALEQRLSPLQLTLPDSPLLRSVWLKSVANYERLRMQQRCKRLRLLHRRDLHGLVPIVECQ